ACGSNWQSCSIAEPPSGHFDKDIFEGRSSDLETDKFVAASLQMLDEGNDGLRRARRMQNIGAANFARVGHAFEVAQCAVRFRLREAHFDAGGAAGMRFQFARRAESDYLAEVHDGNAVAESLGFFNVMRRHQDG